jgi:3-oxoacyl-[acyl-carrier-protein] synthase-3
MPRIIGTGMHLPEKLVTNEQMFEQFGREKLPGIYARIGHGARYHSAPNESSGDHAVKAGRAALQNAGLSPKDVDLLIVATDTPAYLSPATAAYVQHELGAHGSGAFDVNCACAAGVTSMDIATKYIRTDPQYKTALVIGTYAMSKFLDPKDGDCYPLFGDGAGAVVLQREEGVEHFISSKLIGDGSYWDYMGIYGGGSAEPANAQMVAEGRQCVRLHKKIPSTVNGENWPRLIESTLAKKGMKPQDMDLVIFTQIRKFSIEDVMKGFGMPMEKTHCIMDKWGYTGSACVPMALHDAIQCGKLSRGDRFVLCASGGGFAMACLAMSY